MKSLLFVIFFSSLSSVLIAQNQDHIWVIGYDFDLTDTDTLFGMLNMDFNKDPMQITRVPERTTSMSGANSSLCDKEGNLIAYSNGQVIVGKDEQMMEDTINYAWDQDRWCREWEYNNIGTSSFALPIGNLAYQNVMILPITDTLNYVFYNS